MFNQDSVPVTVRIAQASDKQVQPKASVSMPAQPVETKVELKEAPVIETVTEDSDTEQTNLKSERIESDQEKMVLDLFDGKYVE